MRPGNAHTSIRGVRLRRDHAYTSQPMCILRGTRAPRLVALPERCRYILRRDISIRLKENRRGSTGSTAAA
jgi:hypothetical protein